MCSLECPSSCAYVTFLRLCVFSEGVPCVCVCVNAIYLRQGGYVFTSNCLFECFVCLSVNRITQILLTNGTS